MKRLIINANDLLSALRSDDVDSYLDYETGEVHVLSFYSPLPFDEWKKYVDGMANNLKRFLLITPLPMSVWKKTTGCFLDTLPADETTTKLRKFPESDQWRERISEVLKTDHELGEKFGDYHKRAVKQLAQQWLEEQKIGAKLN